MGECRSRTLVKYTPGRNRPATRETQVMLNVHRRFYIIMHHMSSCHCDAIHLING